MDSLLDRGDMSLEDGAFKEAKKFFNDALNSNSKCAQAYLGLFMAEIEAEDKFQAECTFVAGNYTRNRFYLRAKQFAQGTLQAELSDWEKKRNDRLAKEAEAARRAKEAAEKAERERKAAAEEQEKKRLQEIQSIREQLRTGKIELTEQQKQEQSRLNAEADRLDKIAKKAAEDYAALPEHSEKARLEKELAERRAYFSTLGLFKGKEKKLVQEQISSMEAKLSAVIKKLETEKKDVDYTKDAASAQANTAADHKAKVENEARKILLEKLMDLLGVKNYTFGHYPQTNNGNDNESIEWQVLDVQGNKVLLLSRYGLDTKPYNTELVNLTWEKCSLRSWLNEDFLNAAFTAEEQKAILTTDVDNSESQGYSKWRTNGGNDTQDKIFLLSCAEANKYLNVTYSDRSNTKSRTSPTAYADAQGAITSYFKTAEGADTVNWWLRSPAEYQNRAMHVYCDGSFGWDYVNDRSVCVRPAFWLDLESDIF